MLTPAGGGRCTLHCMGCNGFRSGRCGRGGAVTLEKALWLPWSVARGKNEHTPLRGAAHIAPATLWKGHRFLAWGATPLVRLAGMHPLFARNALAGGLIA